MRSRGKVKRLLASFLALILVLSTICVDGLVINAEEPGNPGAPTESIVLYKDSDCSNPYANDERICAGTTVYAKISTSQDGRKVSIVGYNFDNENFIWPDGGAPSGYDTESRDGFIYSYDEQNQVASLTIPENKFDRDVSFIGYVFDNEEHNWYISTGRWVSESQKGLAFCDIWEDGAFKTYRYDEIDAKNVTEYRKSKDNWHEENGGFIQFAYASDDFITVDESGIDNLTVIDGSHTPVITGGEGLYLNWDSTYNCWSYYAKNVGEYTVSFDGIDGSVSFTVKEESLSFKLYKDQNCTTEKDDAIFSGDTIYAKATSNDENITYVIYGMSDGSSPEDFMNHEINEAPMDCQPVAGNVTDGVACITLPSDRSDYYINFVLQATWKDDGHSEYYDYSYYIDSSSKGLVISDWYDFENSEFRRFGQDGENVWSEYGKCREMTEGTSRLISFAQCPSNHIEVEIGQDGKLTDNLTILNVPEGNKDLFEIKRESGGTFVTAGSNDAELRYDNEHKCFCFEPKCEGSFRIYYKGDSSESNYITFIVNKDTKHYELYRDSECKDKFDPNENLAAGQTVYAKVWTDEGDTDGLTIVGYGYNWDNNSENWYETQSKDGFEFSVDASTGVATLTLSDYMDGYDVFFAVERKYNEGQDSEVFEQLRHGVCVSRKGLVLCNDGDCRNGFRETSYTSGKEYSTYWKEAAIGVGDRMEFLLGYNPYEYDDGSISKDLTPIKGNTEKFTVMFFNEETGCYENADESLAEFGYSESQEGKCDHYYFCSRVSGRYRIIYDGIEGGFNFVNIEIQKHKLALYNDKNHSDDSYITAHEIIADGKTEYYLYIDNTDPNFVLKNRFFGIIEPGKSVPYYSFNTNDGKFYSQTYKNKKWTISTTPTDLKKYLTIENIGDELYKVVFKSGGYQIQFVTFGTQYENIEDPNSSTWDGGDERFYDIRESNIGKLGVLDWLEGWEYAGDDNDFNPEAMRKGGDSEQPAIYHSGGNYTRDSRCTYVVPGILKDEEGLEADLIPSDAKVKVYRYNSKWVDVTSDVNPTYVGNPESDNEVAKGLWRFRYSDIGNYKMEVTIGEDVYSMEYQVILPSVAFYSSNTSFTNSTLVLGDIHQEDVVSKKTSYYLYGKDCPDGISANGIKGKLFKVNIYWNDFTGKTSTEYLYKDGKFYVDGEDVSDEVKDAFIIENTNTPGLYKITPEPCDLDVEFVFEFDSDNDPYYISNSFLFTHSQRGLVLNSGLADEIAPGVWSGLFNSWNEYNYNKDYHIKVGDTGFFALALNANSKWINKDNCALTRLTDMKGITVKKVDEEGNLTDVGSNTKLQFLNNGVFSFSSAESGDYRIIYNNDSFVNVYVHSSDVGFYLPSADGSYNFDETNAFAGQNITLDLEQAAEGKAEFYVVINGDSVDLETDVIDLVEEYCDEYEQINRSTILYTANPSKEIKESHTTYEKLNLSGKEVTLYGKKVENPVIYKITTCRNDGDQNLIERNFSIALIRRAAWGSDTFDEIMDNVASNDDFDLFSSYTSDFAFVGFEPADISGATIEDISKECVWNYNRLTPVQLKDSDVVVSYNSTVIPSCFYEYKDEKGNSFFKDEHTYPGTEAAFQIYGIGDFTGTAEGKVEINKTQIGAIVKSGDVVKFKYSASQDKLVPVEMPAGFNMLKEGIDYEVTSPLNNTTEIKALNTCAYFYGTVIMSSEEIPCGQIVVPDLGDKIEMQYDGTVKDLKFKVMSDGEVLTEGRDYEVEVSGELRNKGDYNIVIGGCGYYCGIIETILKINPIDISKAVVTGVPTKINYGDEIDSSKITVTLNKVVLPEDCWEVDFDYSKTGNQPLTIKGKGNYDGKIVKTVTVNPETTLKATNAKIVLVDPDKSFVYPSAPEESDFKVQMMGADKTYTELDSENYVITLSSTENAGTVTVTATGKKGYSGSITLKVAYNPKELTKEMIGPFYLGNFTYEPGTRRQLDELFSAIYVQGVDYTVSYTGDTKAGSAKAVVKGIGNYKGTIEYTYQIAKLDIEDCEIENIKAPNWCYFGAKEGDAVDVAASDIVIKINGVTIPTSEYTVTIDKSVKFTAGSLSEENLYEKAITIEGKNNYKGILSFDVKTSSYDLTDISKGYEIKVDGQSAPFEYSYTSDPVINENQVSLYKADGTEIDSDFYKVTLANVTEAGKGSIIVSGMENYTGTLTANVTVRTYDVMENDENFSFSFEGDDQFLISPKGKVNYPTVSVMYKGKTVDPKNYTYSFKANVANGNKASLVVNYKGNFKKKTVTYDGDLLQSRWGLDSTLKGTDISECNECAILGALKYVYTGSPVKPKLTIELDGQKYKETKDYTLSYRDAAGNIVDSITEPGRYYMFINGCGNYSGVKEPGCFITIEPAPIDKASITLAKTKYTFNKDAYDNEGTGYGRVTKVMLGKKELTEGIDYEVFYQSNKKPGTASAIIVGSGLYSGTATKTFTIDGKVDINDVEILSFNNTAYFDSKGAVPQQNMLSYNGDILVQGQDYTVTGSNNKKLTKDGEFALATIKGKGKYTGTYRMTFPYSIVEIPVIDANVSYNNAKQFYDYLSGEQVYIAAVTYTGKAQSGFDPKVKYNGAALKKGTDYDVYYIPEDEYYDITDASDMSRFTSFTDAGNYIIEVRYKGNYSGTSVLNLYVAPMNISKVKADGFKADFTGCVPANDRISVTNGKDKLVHLKDYELCYSSVVKTMENDTLILMGGHYVYFSELSKAYKLNCPSFYNAGDADCTSVGSHVAYIVGTGNYCGVKEVKYDILGEDIKKLNLTASEVVFDPLKATQETYVLGTYTDVDGITRTYDSRNTNNDGFILEYSANTKAGTGKIKVSHKYFKGSKTISYKIKPFDISDTDKWYGRSNPCLGYATYNPKGAKLNFNNNMYYYGDSDNLNNNIRYDFVEGKDFTVSYKNNKTLNDTYTAIADVKFKGNFTGSRTFKFYIVQEGVTRDDVTVTSTGTWKPNVKIVTKSGATLKENTDYTLTYKYAESVKVKCGKLYVQREPDDIVNAKDTVPLGTTICAVITPKGNYKMAIEGQDSTGFCFQYAGKMTSYEWP